MFCEGDKTYESDSGCPVCHMHLEEITEDLVRSQMPDAGSLHTHQNTKHLTPNIHQEGKYYCPMVYNTTLNGSPALRIGDLLQAHPTRPGFWKIYGRADDQIMLSTGEKVG